MKFCPWFVATLANRECRILLRYIRNIVESRRHILIYSSSSVATDNIKPSLLQHVTNAIITILVQSQSMISQYHVNINGNVGPSHGNYMFLGTDKDRDVHCNRNVVILMKSSSLAPPEFDIVTIFQWCKFIQNDTIFIVINSNQLGHSRKKHT